jgi:hypothetical protein
MSGQRHAHSRTRRPIRFWALLAVGALLLAAAVTTGTYTVLRDEKKAADVDSATHSARNANALGGGHLGNAPAHSQRRRPVRHRPTPRRTVAPKPTPAPTQTTTPISVGACSGAPNTPGGSDPWGGCWPGPGNTGPSSASGLSAYSGPCTITKSVVIDDKAVNCELSVQSGDLTLEHSFVNGEVYNNGSGSVLIESTTLNGGSDDSETVGGNNITVLSSNLYGNQHEVYCDDNCTVKNSWLHDNFNGTSQGWHQNGFLSTGGSNYTLQHNSVYCVGNCTSDIGFIPNDNISDATVSQNLFVATADASYCLYPSSNSGKPGTVEEMTVTDNVFQRGPQGKCAFYGPVSNWDSPTSSPNTDGFRNVWSGNVWDNGKALGP